MRTPWKCGKDLPEGQTECEYGCGQGDGPTDAQIKAAVRRQAQNTVHIDWAKVETMEDVRLVLEALFGRRVYFPLGIPDAIKRFLKEDK